MNESKLARLMPYNRRKLYRQYIQRFGYKMPRVVPDQKSKFESDELFRRLSRESDIQYTGEGQLPERQICFLNGCRKGHTEISFVASGTNLELMFKATPNPYIQLPDGECEFESEEGKVHIKSYFIMNGVCVRFRGWLSLERLDGVGCLEYDDRGAMYEDSLLRNAIDQYNQRLSGMF